jgi:hypothetical protein
MNRKLACLAAVLVPLLWSRSGAQVAAGVGVGAQMMHASCGGCLSRNGVGGDVWLGYTLPSRMIIGVEGAGVATDHPAGPTPDPRISEFRTIAGFIEFYPFSTPRFSARALIGRNHLALEFDGATTGRAQLTADALSAGFAVAYDIGIGGGFNVTPYLSVLSTVGADIKRQDQLIGERVDAQATQIGISLTRR